MKINHVPKAYQISQMIRIEEQKRILEYLKKQLDRDTAAKKNLKYLESGRENKNLE